MSHQLEGKTEALYIGSGPLIKAVDDVKSFVKASRYILSDFLFKDDYKTETIGDDLVTITNRDGFDVAAAEPNLGFVLVDSDPACCGDVFGNYLKLPSGLLVVGYHLEGYEKKRLGLETYKDFNKKVKQPSKEDIDIVTKIRSILNLLRADKTNTILEFPSNWIELCQGSSNDIVEASQKEAMYIYEKIRSKLTQEEIELIESQLT